MASNNAISDNIGYKLSFFTHYYTEDIGSKQPFLLLLQKKKKIL